MWNSTFFKQNLNQSSADIQVYLAVKLLTVIFLKKHNCLSLMTFLKLLDDRGPNDNGRLSLISTVMTRTIVKEMCTILLTPAKTIRNSCVVTSMVLTIHKKWKLFATWISQQYLRRKCRGVLAVVQPQEDERWHFLLSKWVNLKYLSCI